MCLAFGSTIAIVEDFHTSVRYVDDVKPHASKSARWPDDDLFNALQRYEAAASAPVRLYKMYRQGGADR